MPPIEINQIKQKRAAGTAAPESKGSGFSDLLNYELSFGNSFSDKKKEAFYSELSVLLEAGINLKSALELMSEEQKKKADQEMMATISRAVIEGNRFSEACRSTEKFSDYEYYTLQIGEESGTLNKVLEDLADFYARKIKQRRTLISSMSYPIVILITALGAVFFMLRFMVPMFEDVFKRVGGDLPGITKIVIKLSDFMGTYFTGFMLVLFVAGIILYTQRKKGWFRTSSARVLLKTPLIGELVKKAYTIRLSQAMSLLLMAKVPLVQAIQLVGKMISFHSFEQALNDMEHEVIKGASLSESMQKHKVFDRKMVALIKVAEETNKLDFMFERLTEQYGEEVEHRSKVLSNVLEPLIILFLGFVVTLILIAMYLPIFRLSTSFGG